jgi:serine protease inhibitor
MHRARRSVLRPIGSCVAIFAVAALMAAVAPAGGRAQGRSPVQALTRAYNGLGEVLFRLMAAKRGNLVFSPYSIGTAMAMAFAGARGETAGEMAAVLQYGMGLAQVNDANAAALSILNGYDKSSVPPTCPHDMQLSGRRCVARPNADGTCNFPAGRSGKECVSAPRVPRSAKLLIANALMLASAGVSNAYATLLKDRYSAQVFRGAGLDTVNGWVKQRTEGKIEKILSQMSDVVLLNAVYFKSHWALVFNKKLTKDEFFNVSRRQQELVRTMLQRAHHRVVTRDGYRAIRLPYVVRALAMVIVLPDEIDGVDAVARRLDMAELSKLLTALRGRPLLPVVLTLPRFKAASKVDLKKLFQQAGMKRPFDLAMADFSGITGMPPSKAPFAISQIVHRAVIEVMEESTEAAAATGIGMVGAGAPRRINPIQFHVDRPFLYYIVDDATGAVLFQGRIVDPRST